MADLGEFRRLLQSIETIRAAAEAGDWDRFLLLQQDYQQAHAALPPLASLRIAETERTELAFLLEGVQASLAAVLPLAQAHKSHLAAELAGIHNAGMLNRAYGQ